MSHQGTTSTQYTRAHKKGVSQTTTDYERELARDQIKRNEVYSFPRVKLHLAEEPKFHELVELPIRNCDLGPLHQLASRRETDAYTKHLCGARTRIHSSSPPVTIPSQPNPIHPPDNLPKIHSDPILPSTPWSSEWSDAQYFANKRTETANYRATFTVWAVLTVLPAAHPSPSDQRVQQVLPAVVKSTDSPRLQYRLEQKEVNIKDSLIQPKNSKNSRS
jgi:hypothetical protein